ncbi:DNA helicase [Roridomyces roridus]|uniref:DNA 3'-5' helicase n=1 Tax=Roridomyces roridus TaxID=1738132 RepID=A0AAD7FPN9_9AGAR|nr:DNA helicase [Roridomyces roridus]
MSSVQNNLGDVLKARTANPTSSVPAAAQPKPAKFKPATSNSISASIRKQPSTTLPSFSTPGFHKSRSNVSHATSISTSSTPSPGLKRTSSDSQIASESLPSKRPKYGKENVEIAARSKGKAKAEPVIDADDDDEPWKRMELGETNPFTILDRDFPQFCQAAAEAPPATKYPDLVSKSTEELNTILLFNFEADRQNMASILDYHSGDAKKQDICTLDAIKSVLNDRIAAIKEMLAYRERVPSAITRCPAPIPADVRRPPPSPGPSTIVRQGSTASMSRVQPPPSPGPSTIRSFEPISRQGSTTTSRIHESFVESDADEEYWAEMDDVEMDGIEDKSRPVVEPTGPYAAEVQSKLKQVFLLREFRKNQFEAINATMDGRDVFVLMPTGGGKSLCYQLPAVCSSGKTKGVTVVVSPLVALIKDQVTALQDKGVDAVFLTSEDGEGKSREVSRRFFSSSKPTLLYITPERIKISAGTKSMLTHLYQRKELARFVIDEAHCISTWGQDFREAYQELHTLRDDFPDIPIMALTATANQRTVDDILVRLKMVNPAVFEQSFNRTNLIYNIVPKQTEKDMIAYIQRTYANQAGIIYRTSRDNCEKLAKKLRDAGLNAKHFHAKMETADKEATLREWQHGECNIIVATIAFGMGIDKPNVRFVIHYDLPKTMDGYYQETGRAGRDGLPADCILHYCYKDSRTILRMIKDPKDRTVTRESIERQEQALRLVVQYCENQSECRRTQVLQYFGEKFDAKDCLGKCNNCVNAGLYITEEVTEQAKGVLRLVQSLEKDQQNVTINTCQSIFRGSNLAAIRDKGYDHYSGFGAGSDMQKELVELLFNRLVHLDALREQSTPTNAQWHVDYVKLGPRASDFLTGKTTLKINHRPKTPKPGAKPKSTKRKPAAVNTQLHESMYVDDDIQCSSPPKPVQKSRPVVEIISDSEDDTLDLYHQLVEHRRTILSKNPSLRKEDVLDDEMLRLMSTAVPQDFMAFKRIMKGAQDVEQRWELYGKGFLSLCQGRTVGTWKDKYAFPAQPVASTSSGPGSVRKFKFVTKSSV